MTELAQRNNFGTNFNNNLNMSELLNNELALDGQYHPNLGGITRGGMTNHYPMTILSMHELGASDQQIRNFKAQWPRHRALINEHLGLLDQQQITTKNWHLHLGKSNKLKEFRRVFFDQMSEYDSAEVVTDALAHMQNGLPMGLFHPLIKLSFAAMHGDKGLLADALAYMAIRYHDVYRVEATQSSEISAGSALQTWSIIRDLKQKNELLAALPNLTYGGSISVCEQLCSSKKVQTLALNTAFTISATKLDDTIKEVTGAAIQLYLSEPSLTTLHAVTASQALADLTRRFVNNDHSNCIFANLWQRYWVWLSALFIEKGCTQLSIEPNSTNQTKATKVDWQQLSNKALNTNEVHIIKMVYSCKWLFENIDANPLYHQAAQTML
jgi:hypothetical protein